jgi:crossover junction endodeoxyribonuclease RuvC
MVRILLNLPEIAQADAADALAVAICHANSIGLITKTSQQQILSGGRRRR